MSEGRNPGATRRVLMENGLGLGLGIALVAVVPPLRSAPKKVSKQSGDYVDDGKLPGKDCDDCINFVAAKSAQEAPTCKIVEGPINPHGHCIAFAPAK